MINFATSEYCSKTKEEYDAIPDPSEDVSGAISKPTEITREPVEETKTDWGAVARGKIRSLFLQAKIERDGIVALTPTEMVVLDSLVEIAMGDKK